MSVLRSRVRLEVQKGLLVGTVGSQWGHRGGPTHPGPDRVTVDTCLGHSSHIRRHRERGYKDVISITSSAAEQRTYSGRRTYTEHRHTQWNNVRASCGVGGTTQCTSALAGLRRSAQNRGGRCSTVTSARRRISSSDMPNAALVDPQCSKWGQVQDWSEGNAAVSESNTRLPTARDVTLASKPQSRPQVRPCSGPRSERRA